MNTKVLQTPTLGFVVGHCEEDTEDVWIVRNPRIIQAYTFPETDPKTEKTIDVVNFNLINLMYDPLLKDDGPFIMTVPKRDYVDVTGQMNPYITERYNQIMLKIEQEKAKGFDEDVPVDSDTK